MFLFITLITVVLSLIMVVFNWRNNKNAIFLALLFIIFASYGATHYFSVFAESEFWLAIFFAHFSPLWLLTGPLLYFYVRGTLTDKQGLSLKDIWHFLPSLIHLIGIAPYLIKPFSYKLQIAEKIIANLDNLKYVPTNWIYSNLSSFYFRILLLIGYIVYCIIMLWNYKPSKAQMKQIPSRQLKISFRWLTILHITISIITLAFLNITIKFSGSEASSSIISSMPVHLLSGVAFLIMSFSMLLFPEVLYGIPIYRHDRKKNDRSGSIKGKNLRSTKFKEAFAAETDDPFSELAIKVLSYMEVDKPYLNPEFSLTNLASALKVPQHHLSYCFSAILKTRFTELRTQMRIAHAKELLQNGKANELSIDGIGKESGFASRSNFYSAFKTETGLTPNEFLQQRP